MAHNRLSRSHRYCKNLPHGNGRCAQLLPVTACGSISRTTIFAHRRRGEVRRHPSTLLHVNERCRPYHSAFPEDHAAIADTKDDGKRIQATPREATLSPLRRQQRRAGIQHVLSPPAWLSHSRVTCRRQRPRGNPTTPSARKDPSPTSPPSLASASLSLAAGNVTQQRCEDQGSVLWAV